MFKKVAHKIAGYGDKLAAEAKAAAERAAADDGWSGPWDGSTAQFTDTKKKPSASEKAAEKAAAVHEGGAHHWSDDVGVGVVHALTSFITGALIAKRMTHTTQATPQNRAALFSYFFVHT